ncbi:MAG: thioredoxin family protein [Bradymonadales bacterium]|nr:MAG: thioredoxin family protein [Bradymonadales bacterium]
MKKLFGFIFIASLGLGSALMADQKAEKAQGRFGINSPMPVIAEDWGKMKGIDGKEYTLQSVKGEKGTLVVFTCVHCPFVVAWDPRLANLVEEFRAKGINTIYINPNDYEAEKRDHPDHMRTQMANLVENTELTTPIPYVVDSTSKVARLFGATRTPEIFLFDANNRLVYTGAIDSNHREAPAQGSEDDFLRVALTALVEGKPITKAQTVSRGCTIKWRNPS